MTQTICLNMIVRNEEHVIERCLNSARGFISSYCVVDTGSTDATIKKIKHTLRDVPGHVHKRPWKDFGFNRTQAIHLAKDTTPNPDYLLFIDADEEFEFPAGWQWPELTVDGYFLDVQYGGVSYSRCALVSTRKNWRWEGVLHEYLTSTPDDAHKEHLPGPRIIVHHEGARAKDPDTYKKDAVVLERALKREPDNTRYTFYLAQTYWDLKDWPKAHEWYTKRALMGGWEEEVFYSIYRLGQIAEALGKNPTDQYLGAWQCRPTRAEPLSNLAKWFRSKNVNHLAQLFEDKAATIPYPKDMLFVERGAYSKEEAPEAPCPMCNTTTREKKNGTPYYVCSACNTWFQEPMPPKIWHGAHEPPPASMSENEKEANRWLARRLFEKFLKPGATTLDIGAAYPVLANTLKELGCDALAIDGEVVAPGVTRLDFENDTLLMAPQNLITLIHTFEHFYNPIKALQALDIILAPGGVLFLRSPDHTVPGYERDLTPGHYSIHPFIHSAKGIHNTIKKLDLPWELVETYPLEPGQSDMIFRKRPTKEINLHRPGAIGDILMTLNMVPALKRKHPDAQINYYSAYGDQLGELMRAAGVHGVHGLNKLGGKHRVDLIGYPLHEGYPDKPMARHLLDYFAVEMGVPRGQLILPLPPRPHDAPKGRYVTLQTKAGWSKYKEWPQARWEMVVEKLKAMGVEVVDLDERFGRKLPHTIALFAHAFLHLGIDSFCNHLTNYIWEEYNEKTGAKTQHQTTGVIIFGSTQARASGYEHNINLSTRLPCQPCFRENPAMSLSPRGPCVNPPRSTYEDDLLPKCMNQITGNHVLEAVFMKLNEAGYETT